MDRIIEFVGNHVELCGLFAVLLGVLWYTEKQRSGRSVSPQETTLMLNRDQAVVVDLRDKKDHSEGWISGSVHIPFANLKERAVELAKHKDKQIVLVDKMGQHTGMAGKLLQAEGFENVCRMTGGITEWKNSHMPLIRK